MVNKLLRTQCKNNIIQWMFFLFKTGELLFPSPSLEVVLYLNDCKNFTLTPLKCECLHYIMQKQIKNFCYSNLALES